MSKFFYDTEFLEGTQTKRILGIQVRFFILILSIVIWAISWIPLLYWHKEVGIILVVVVVFLQPLHWFVKDKTKPTIDLISIGIVADDGREYYAISKDFNLKEAWERYDMKTGYNHGDMRNDIGDTWEKKEYWIRENVLKTIFKELSLKERTEYDFPPFLPAKKREFTYKNMKRLINRYGKTNAEIAKEIKEFCLDRVQLIKVGDKYVGGVDPIKGNPELYGYFSAYDHVALAWLWGKMIDLPEGFPMYTIDLKQMLDEKAKDKSLNCFTTINTQGRSPEWWIENFKKKTSYPKQTNEHHALKDARWNRDLHSFIKSL